MLILPSGFVLTTGNLLIPGGPINELLVPGLYRDSAGVMRDNWPKEVRPGIPAANVPEKAR